MKKPATVRALVRLALVTAAALAAAVLCSQNRPEQGLLLPAGAVALHGDA